MDRFALGKEALNRRGVTAADQRAGRRHDLDRADLGNNLGQENASAIGAGDTWGAVVEGRSIVDVVDGMRLRCVRVMNDYRVELSGFTEGMRDRLRAFGLFKKGTGIRFEREHECARPRVLRSPVETLPR